MYKRDVTILMWNMKITGQRFIIRLSKIKTGVVKLVRKKKNHMELKRLTTLDQEKSEIQ